MQMKIAVCDDEKQQLQYLEKLIGEWAQSNKYLVNVQSFRSAESFLFEWEENKQFEIVLLDIEMGEQNGVELAKTIRQHDENVMIIFVTGLPEYIEEGYEVSALHYLLKPVNEDRLWRVLDKAVSRLQKVEKSLLLTVEGEAVKLLQKEIFAAEASAHSVCIYTEQETYELRKNISNLEAELDAEAFIRCHRSYIVGLRHIKRIGKTEILLDNEQSIPLSRRMYQGVHTAFIKYFRGANE
ncbi:MAG: LytR/AlgR family response regulator transcription factor [Cellulosilyticaceae bacterium]